MKGLFPVKNIWRTFKPGDNVNLYSKFKDEYVFVMVLTIERITEHAIFFVPPAHLEIENLINKEWKIEKKI